MHRSRIPCDVNVLLRAVIVLACSATACGGDSAGASLECGTGTVKQNNQCVLASVAHDDGGVHVTPKADAGMPDRSDAGTVTATSCGAGTIEKDGKCIVDPAMQLACGDGTIPSAGKCLVAPPPPKNIDGLVITQLALRNRGQLVVDGGKIHQFYPIEFSIGLTYKGDAAKIPVVFALGEPPDASKPDKDLAFCLVGGFAVDHPGGSVATESIASVTLQIPKGCLGMSETVRTVSPIVLIDPDGTVGAKNPDTVTRSVAFLKTNDEDDMKACRVGATENGAKGTCQLEATIDASPGIDFGIVELTAESSVVVIDKCGAGADLTRPVSYRCNSKIVPEFKIIRDSANQPVLDGNGNTQVMLDSNGAPIQETYVFTDPSTMVDTTKPKFVYGPADLDLDVTVITYGAPVSNVSDADQAMKLDPLNDTKAVNNVLGDHGLQIQYTIRPSSSDNANDWKPLYLHKPGEQAKAGEATESGQDKAPFEESVMAPATPHYYSHGLYVENDCGERNTATCDMTLNPRTDIVSGVWADQTDFIVRACLVPVDAMGATDNQFDDNPDNNCKDIPIKLVRHDTSGASTMASSYGFNFQWADGEGSQTTMRIAWGFHSWNKVDTTGATTDNEGAITLGSDLVGYTDVLKGWAKGAAYVSLVGSYYDYGISTFGVKLWGDAKTVPAFHWDQDWSVSKVLSKSAIVWAGVVPVTLTLSIGGTAGVGVSLDVIGLAAPVAATEESGTFLNTKTANATRIGLAQLAVTPYGDMTVIATAAINAVVVRVGISGQLSLMSMRVPLTGRMWWGLTSAPSSSAIAMKVGAWADMKLAFSVMSGEIYVFAENQSLAWCSKKIKIGFARITVHYPCGSDWDTFWDMTIADWSGWSWNQTLWTSPYVEYVIP